MNIQTIDTMLAENLSLIACNPQQMAASQQPLIDWCLRKIATLRQEHAELSENLDICKRNGWRTVTLSKQVNLTKKRMIFYGKIANAVKAGYIIVPDFPVDVFAVRTDRESPKYAAAYSPDSSQFTQKALAIPEGEGRYVSPEPFRRNIGETYTDPKTGEKKNRDHWVVSDFDEVLDFPIKAVKPEVLQATAEAMARKLFDEIGVIEHRPKQDPIVVGKILDPRSTAYNRRYVTFFVAWWLNTEDL